MSLTTCMMILMLLPSWIAAEDDLNKNRTEQIFTIIALIFATFLATLGLASLTYVIFTFLKRKVSEPQYVIDDRSHHTDGSESPYATNDTTVRIPHISQIQPVFNVR